MKKIPFLFLALAFAMPVLAGGHSYQPGRILSFDTAQHMKGHGAKNEIVYSVQAGSVVYKVTDHSSKHKFSAGEDVECRADSKHLYIEKRKGGEVKFDILGESSQ